MHNVIDLRERRQRLVKSESGMGIKMDQEQKKMAIAASIVSIVAIVTFANRSLYRTATDQQATQASNLTEKIANQGGRAIASVPAFEMPESEKALAHKLASADLEETGKLGLRATSMDQLTLGFLEGKYAVQMRAGKLEGLDYSDALDANQTPKFVDRMVFLQQTRDLMPVQFKSVQKVNSDETQLEVYDLLGRNREPVAQVEFRLDTEGRLLSMRVSVRKFAMLDN